MVSKHGGMVVTMAWSCWYDCWLDGGRDAGTILGWQDGGMVFGGTILGGVILGWQDGGMVLGLVAARMILGQQARRQGFSGMVFGGTILGG